MSPITQTVREEFATVVQVSPAKQTAYRGNAMTGAMDTRSVVDRLWLRIETLTARVEQQAAGIMEQRARLIALERANGRAHAE